MTQLSVLLPGVCSKTASKKARRPWIRQHDAEAKGSHLGDRHMKLRIAVAGLPLIVVPKYFPQTARVEGR
jgi:hypothetical protein